MSLTVTLMPERTSVPPGSTTALTLHLRNEAAESQVIKLTPSGELAANTVLETATIHLDAGESFDVPVLIDVSADIAAGPHPANIDVATGSGDAVQAVATIDVDPAISYSSRLQPVHSGSSSTGRHRVIVENTGNASINVEFDPSIEGASAIEMATQSAIIDPGAKAEIDLRIKPAERFWRGLPETHPFTIRVIGPEGEGRLEGSFEQRPRIGAWVLPSVIGMVGALIIGTIAWFALLKPAVRDIAEDAIADDRATLREQIAELEAAAEEAKELPFGEPTDLRLEVSAAAGAADEQTYTIGSDRVLSVTDIVFQNPTGAVGLVTIERNGETLLDSQLANFRDLDFHYVAPYAFAGGDTIGLTIECTTPGPGTDECSASATISGFVD